MVKPVFLTIGRSLRFFGNSIWSKFSSNVKVAGFDPELVKDTAQSILAFLNSNCTEPGHTYWLFKEKDMSSKVKIPWTPIRLVMEYLNSNQARRCCQTLWFELFVWKEETIVQSEVRWEPVFTFSCIVVTETGFKSWEGRNERKFNWGWISRK